MKENLRKKLKELTSFTAISGSEHEMAKHMKESLEEYADEVIVDPIGNIIAVKHGKTEGPKLMISAHTDEIGFMVKNILPNGYILFEKIGGVPDKVMEARKVLVNGKIPGIIGIKPGHLQTAEESRMANTVEDCYIDVAASSKEEVEALGIKIGDPIGFKSSFMEMANSDYISTKSIDNRINCAILLELFEHLENVEFEGTIYGVATVQEEVGMKGAFIAGNRIDPDYAIAIDTIPAGDVPDINTDRDLPIRLGGGPVCVIGDALNFALLTTFADKNVVNMIRTQAESVDVNLQEVTLMSKGYATDAARLSFAGSGIPCGTLSIPRRYSHSPVELVNLNDAVDSVKVLEGIVKNNGNAKFSFI